jgi:hypothetical protein
MLAMLQRHNLFSQPSKIRNAGNTEAPPRDCMPMANKQQPFTDCSTSTNVETFNNKTTNATRAESDHPNDHQRKKEQQLINDTQKNPR